MNAQPADLDPSQQLTINRVMWRLIPFIVFLYILNYIDRVNISFAKLHMSRDLKFSDAVYGFGAGIFFLGYFLFEVPSNLIMQRVGARLWMARIMISWGIISACFMFVRGPVSFYVLRFLLGVAEAGFAPGVLLYLTYWIPARQQGRAVAWFLTSTALAGLIGLPLAGVILKLDGAYLLRWKLAGWQWLFLVEGIPSMIFGTVVLFVLNDRPNQAKWLAADERTWLAEYLDAEKRQRDDEHGLRSLGDALVNGRVALLSFIYCLIMFAFQGINYWMPTIITKVTGLDSHAHSGRIGLLSAIPYVAAAVCMVFVGRYSDRTGRRSLHVAICAIVGAIGLAMCAATTHPALAIAALTLAAGAIWSTLGPFWALPPAFLCGTAAAAGIALINSIGNLGGGFPGQYMLGWLSDKTHSYRPGLLIIAGGLVLAAGLIMLIRAPSARVPSDRYSGQRAG